MSNDVKYQVFVSSTYTDLVEERKGILDILLIADCIPAGMENFVAQDDEQFKVIKRIIDLCDYYILILGKRYGSINPNTGISYTEMEYNYAVEKGIPVLAFIMDDSVEISPDLDQEDIIKKGKLAEFKKRAMKNRLASEWRDKADLIGKVSVAIMKAKYEMVRPGWHRGIDDEKVSLKSELEKLRKENKELRAHIQENITTEVDLHEKFYGYQISLHYTEKVFMVTSNTVIDHKIITTTLDELYKHISLQLTGKHSVEDFMNAVSSFKEGYYVKNQDALIVKNKYEQLKLIKTSIDARNNEFIELTDMGRNIMNELNA